MQSTLHNAPRSAFRGFTLVELIVVITILAILGTIGFLSLQSYTARSRDSSRVADIANISRALNVYVATAGNYPMPDSQYGTGTINGVSLSYVGYAGSRIASLIDLDSPPSDPLTSANFVYGVDANLKQFQLGATLEWVLTAANMDFIVPNAYAAPTGSIRAYVSGQYTGLIRVGSAIYNPPSLLVSNSGVVDMADANTRLVMNASENIPYSIQGASLGSITPAQSLPLIGSTAASVTGVTLTNWATQSGSVATSVGYPVNTVGMSFFGSKDYAAGQLTIPPSTTWSLAGGGDCSQVSNASGSDGNTSTCTDARTYAMQGGATHDKTYSLLKIGGIWWFNENLAYPIPTGYNGSGVWSATDNSSYSCPGNNGTSTADCTQVATRGYIYQWSAMMAGGASTDSQAARVQGICPVGWAIPTKSDYTTAGSAYWPASDFSYLGNTAGWLKYYPGTRTNDAPGTFSNIWSVEYLWTSLQDGANAAFVLWTDTGHASTVMKTNAGKAIAQTVRCIKHN